MSSPEFGNITYPAEVALGWKRERDEAMASVATLQSSVYALEARVMVLRQALEEIVNPVKYMLARVPDGHVIDGVMACRLAGMPEHLQQIADKALRGDQ